jgi:hypothetical protein
MGRAFRRSPNHFDLEHSGPMLTGYKESIVLWIVGDAIENRFGINHLIGRQQSCEVDPRDHALSRSTLMFPFYHNVPSFLEGIRVTKSQRCGAIACDPLFRRAAAKVFPVIHSRTQQDFGSQVSQRQQPTPGRRPWPCRPLRHRHIGRNRDSARRGFRMASFASRITPASVSN